MSAERGKPSHEVTLIASCAVSEIRPVAGRKTWFPTPT